MKEIKKVFSRLMKKLQAGKKIIKQLDLYRKGIIRMFSSLLPEKKKKNTSVKKSEKIQQKWKRREKQNEKKELSKPVSSNEERELVLFNRGFLKAKTRLAMITSVFMIVMTIPFTLIVHGSNNQKKLQSHLTLGYKMLENLEYEQAIAEFSKIIDIEPRLLDAYAGLADAYLAIDDDKTALKLLELGMGITEDFLDSAEVMPDAGEALYLKAKDIYEKNNDYDKAVEVMERGVDNFDSNQMVDALVDSYYAVIQDAYEKGDTEKADKNYKNVTDKKPETAEDEKYIVNDVSQQEVRLIQTKLNKAEIAVNKEAYEEAIDLYEEVISIAGTHVKAYLGLAKAYSGLLETEESLEYLDMAIDFSPGGETKKIKEECADVYIDLATRLSEAGSEEEAIYVLEEGYSVTRLKRVLNHKDVVIQMVSLHINASHASGSYEETIQVSLDTEGSQIYYSLNKEINVNRLSKDKHVKNYQEPILLAEGSHVLYAVAADVNGKLGNIYTFAYEISLNSESEAEFDENEEAEITAEFDANQDLEETDAVPDDDDLAIEEDTKALTNDFAEETVKESDVDDNEEYEDGEAENDDFYDDRDEEDEDEDEEEDNDEYINDYIMESASAWINQDTQIDEEDISADETGLFINAGETYEISASANVTITGTSHQAVYQTVVYSPGRKQVTYSEERGNLSIFLSAGQKIEIYLKQGSLELFGIEQSGVSVKASGGKGLIKTTTVSAGQTVTFSATGLPDQYEVAVTCTGVSGNIEGEEDVNLASGNQTYDLAGSHVRYIKNGESITITVEAGSATFEYPGNHIQSY